jgi:GDPmannose 4,6-dehydratase
MARISKGLQKKLYIGNLDARRDWGHARDYVEMQWLMLQQDQPDDYVISTGLQHTVREFIELAAKAVGISIRWEGQGLDEKGIDADSGNELICIDPRYFRPTEVDTLLGDSTKARQQLGWAPKTTFSELVKEMVTMDLLEAEKDKLCLQEGFQTYYQAE